MAVGMAGFALGVERNTAATSFCPSTVGFRRKVEIGRVCLRFPSNAALRLPWVLSL